MEKLSDNKIVKGPEIKKLDPVQERIGALKGLREGLRVGAQVEGELALVVLGLKPGTQINVGDAEKAKDVSKILVKAGLMPETIERDGQVVVVSTKSKDKLDELKVLSPSKDHEEFGRMMGYPESAIKAFANKDLLLPDDQQKELTKDLPFFSFKISRDNFQRELKVIEQWNRAILKYSPDLIDRVYDIETAERFKKHLSSLN
mgnify:CR=1 FL=1